MNCPELFQNTLQRYRALGESTQKKTILISAFVCIASIALFSISATTPSLDTLSGLSLSLQGASVGVSLAATIIGVLFEKRLGIEKKRMAEMLYFQSRGLEDLEDGELPEDADFKKILSILETTPKTYEEYRNAADQMDNCIQKYILSSRHAVNYENERAQLWKNHQISKRIDALRKSQKTYIERYKQTLPPEDPRHREIGIDLQILSLQSKPLSDRSKIRINLRYVPAPLNSF